MKVRKVVFCLLLSVMLTVTFVPTFAFAAPADEADVVAEQDAETQGTDVQNEDIQDEAKEVDNAKDGTAEQPAKASEPSAVENGETEGVVKALGDTKDGEEPYWTVSAKEFNVNLSKTKTEAELEVITDISECEEPPVLSYRWYYYDEDNGLEDLEGESDSIVVSKEGYYYCEVTDEEEHSNQVEFWVGYETEWTARAKEYNVNLSKTKTEGELEVITDISECEEPPVLSYRWYYYDEDNGLEDLEGESDSIVVSKEGYYYCEVTDEEEHSNQVEFWVGYETEWTARAKEYNVNLSKTKTEGELQVITDTSACEEPPVLSYRWYHIEEGYGQVELEGESDSIVVSKEGSYYCVVTDEKGHSNQVDFWVGYETEWTVWADEDEVDLSKTKTEVELHVITDTSACEEPPDLRYQWYHEGYNEEGDYSPVELEGETDSIVVSNEGNYYCIVTDEEGYSNTVRFWVGYETGWTVEAFEKSVFLTNGEAELKVITDIEACEENPNLSYQWYSLGADEEGEIEIEIPDANESTYIATVSDSYRCVVTDKDGHWDYVEFEVLNDFADLDDVIDSAEPLGIGEEADVNTTGLFEFKPSISGTYMFCSTSSEGADPVGRVLDKNGNELARDDDSMGDDGNFQIVFVAEANETYYLQAINYLGEATYTIKLLPSNLVGITYVPSTETLLAERDCDEDKYYIYGYGYRVGDIVTLEYSNGTSIEYVCKSEYDEEDDYETMSFVNDSGEEFPGQISFDMDWEYGSENAPGSTKTITTKAEYAGLESEEFATTVEFVLIHDYELVHHAATEATCAQTGNIEYWTCRSCGKHFSDAEGTTEITEAETVLPAGHKLTHHDATEATCAQTGNIEYWTCEDCGKYFKDAEGTTEITEGETVLPAGHKLIHHDATEATCAQTGNIEYWTCEGCGKYFKDAEGTTEITEEETVTPIDEEAHAYKATYKWAEDYSSCKATAECQHDSTHEIITEEVQTTSAVTKAATCTTKGTTTYTAKFENTLFETQTKAIDNIDMIGHNWEIGIVTQYAGLYRDGAQCDRCSNCGVTMNWRVIDGYATSYVKSMKVSKAKKAFTVKWKKQSKKTQKLFNGYQIRYSKYADMSGAKYATASKSSKSKKIKRLAAKTKYYVQVRTYTKKNGKTYYSNWTTKTVKTK